MAAPRAALSVDADRAGEQGAAFAPAEPAWRDRLGTVRNAVRQELVARQLRAHLPAGCERPLRILDAGCGQGTQALALARVGHEVVGVDVSDALLGDARAAAAAEPAAVRARLSFERADVLALGPGFARGFDVVCCHGVLMYVASLRETLAALAGAARRGGLLSVLTRNRASLATSAARTGDWQAVLDALDAREYTNRLGVQGAQAHEIGELRAALARAGARTLAWYGVRVFCDHLPDEPPPADFELLLAAEQQAGEREPYRAVAAMVHVIARVET